MKSTIRSIATFCAFSLLFVACSSHELKVTEETWVGVWEDGTGYWIEISKDGSGFRVTRSGVPVRLEFVSLSEDLSSLTYTEHRTSVIYRHTLRLLSTDLLMDQWFDTTTGSVWRESKMRKKAAEPGATANDHGCHAGCFAPVAPAVVAADL